MRCVGGSAAAPPQTPQPTSAWRSMSRELIHEQHAPMRTTGRQAGSSSIFLRPSRLPVFLLHFSLSLLGCGKSPSSTAAKSVESAAPDAAIVLPAPEPLAQDLWSRAKDNVTSDDGDDLARLADREGMLGILARAEDPAWRMTAIRAMPYVDGFEPLPWLAGIARGASND